MTEAPKTEEMEKIKNDSVRSGYVEENLNEIEKQAKVIKTRRVNRHNQIPSVLFQERKKI